MSDETGPMVVDALQSADVDLVIQRVRPQVGGR
jgi:hypothetical protein